MKHNYYLDIASRLSDYLLLNAHCLSHSGLANGKAGVALAIGLLGKCADDEYLQGQCINILEEALLYKGKDLSFDDGWAGICRVLLILLKEGVLDADYLELVGEQHRAIKTTLQNLSSRQTLSPSLILGLIRMLSEYQTLYPSSEICTIISNSQEVLEARMQAALELWLSSSASKRIEVARASDLIEMLVQYLQYCKSFTYTPSQKILSRYEGCFHTGQLPSDLRLGLLLEEMGYRGIAVEEHLSFGCKQLEHPTTLSNILEVLEILRKANLSDARRELMLSFEERIGVSRKFDESKLIRYLPMGEQRIGYASGIARLILYCLRSEGSPLYGGLM